MDFTYTVRVLAERVQISPAAWELRHGGAVVTVRQGHKVVKQFPRVRSEQGGHQLAQAWIRRVQRDAAQATRACHD